MRSVISPAWLACVVFVSACAASPGPARPVEDSSTPSVAVPVDSAPAAGATGRVEAAPPPENETGCFEKPVTLGGAWRAGGREAREVKAVDAGLPRKLAACPSDSDPDACRFTVARIYYEANHIADAGPIFREIALAGDRGALGARAAQYYVDCLNLIGNEAEPTRQACFDEMARDVAPLKTRLCADWASPASAALAPPRETAEACLILHRIEGDLERLRAEELVKQADKGPPDALPLFRKAGDAYMALFEKKCAFRRPTTGKKAAPPPGWTPESRCDEIVYNAIRAYMAAHEMELARGARATLLDPIHKLEKGPLARKAQSMEIR